MIFDICIAGAGAVGGMLARELSRYKLNICLLDRENDAACGATKANSAIVHGGFDPVPGTLKAKLNVRGIPLLKKASEELHFPFLPNGSMVTALQEQEKGELFSLMERGRQNGAKGLELLSGEQAKNLEPYLSDKTVGALLSKEAAITSPYELTLAAVGNAMDNGVTFLRNFEITSITKENEIFELISADTQRVQCRYLVNCAGGFADRIARLCGDDFFEILPRAGEYLLLDKTEGKRVSHTIFRLPDENGKGILVAPTVDGNLLAGPTARPVSSFESNETTAAGLEAVRAAALRSVPSVDFSKVITSFCGVRASTAGGDFIIQASERMENLVHCAGIDSPGLSSCCAIAEYTIGILEKLSLPLEEKKNWNPYRPDPHAFRKFSSAEKDCFIREHPTYGHIVCRCELISEGEINRRRTYPKSRRT